MGLEGGSDLLVGVCGLAGCLVLLVANVGLVAFDRWFGGNEIARNFSQRPEVAAPSAPDADPSRALRAAEPQF
jgi:hypothetical protein